MTPKPKILRKVEELSECIAKLMDRCDEEENFANPNSSLVDKDHVLFWPDFLVYPESARRFCHYGGEKLCCRENKTQIESECQFNDLQECLFSNCVVRKYADAYKSGMQFLEEQK